MTAVLAAALAVQAAPAEHVAHPPAHAPRPPTPTVAALASSHAPAWLAPDQYLFGSGEAAALSRTTWAALVDYATRVLSMGPRQSVVLAPDATLAAPRFTACGDKPAAVVFDLDETVLLNLGWQYDDAAAGARAFDDARWRRWERTGADKVAPTPGAIEGVSRLRALGAAIVFNSNRDAALAADAIEAIAQAGLGQAVHGQTLFLKGDDAQGIRKDGRRARIADLYCVIAMAGDQLGDFTDLFDAGLAVADRRAATATPAMADMWGEGWFVFPNPVYGAARQGDIGDIFPQDKRWTDPGEPPATLAPPAPGPK